MNRWLAGPLVAAVVVGGGALAVAAAALAWSRASARTVAGLHAAERPAGAEVYSPAQLAGLPAPVARYFRFALAPGQPIVRRARIEHAGEFQLALDRPAVPFTSVQRFTLDRPGFVWDARIHLVPLLPVRVRDSYIAGTGSMLGKLGALVPVARAAGTPEMAASALQRYLAEAPWVPTTLLPGHGVSWEAVDDGTARATLRDGDLAVSVDFHFAPSGEIRGMSALRYRDVDGRGVLTPFEGRHLDYARRGGMMVPTRGEVSWILPEGRLTFWRGGMTAAVYGPRDAARPRERNGS